MTEATSGNGASSETQDGEASDIELSPVQYRGRSRSASIPACMVTKDDLRRLYRSLDEMAREALERQLDEWERPPDKTEEEFHALKEKVREVGALTVVVRGGRGEEFITTSREILKDTELPKTITSVTFDSSLALRSYNFNVSNQFRLHLDFTEPPTFQEYNPWSSPTPNESKIEVNGPRDTWVTGVYEWVIGFFDDRKRRWGALHSATTFNLLNWLVGVPGALWTTYRLHTQWIEGVYNLPEALVAAGDIYLFLLALLVFRVIIGGFRWLFPLVEIEGSRPKGVRALGMTLLVGPPGVLLIDVLRVLFGS